jgi:hypothetical protein
MTSWLNTPALLAEFMTLWNAEIPDYYQMGLIFSQLWRQYFDITLNN